MEEQTTNLLRECNKGCKMGINSIKQVKEYVTEEKLLKVLNHYDKEHKKLEEETALILGKNGRTEKEPETAAKVFSWISTEMKLMIKEEDRQIAKIMMDGCNMGIQSISEYINQYPEASGESIACGKKIIKMEEQFMKDLQQFM